MLPPLTKIATDELIAIAGNGLQQVQTGSFMTTSSMEVGAAILNKTLGSKIFFGLLHHVPISLDFCSFQIPTEAEKAFLFYEFNGVWTVLMVIKSTKTVYMYDGLGDAIMKDFTKDHKRRLQKMRRLEVLFENDPWLAGITNFEDMSVHSGNDPRETGLCALTWAEWQAKGFKCRYSKSDASIWEGTIWKPHVISEWQLNPTPDYDDDASIEWHEIWEHRFREVRNTGRI
ncbi:hypothetical protein V8F33_012813 [Rhypophila sp. PSN 637]